MKLISGIFIALLLLMHVFADNESVVGQPLSVFRDGSQDVQGYLLFALLLLMCGLMVRVAVRLRLEGETFVYCLATLLLAIVVATPSWDGSHLFCSLLLLAVVYCNYVWRLHQVSSLWLLLHLAVPMALIAVSKEHGFGLWQKCLILYLVLAMNVDYHILRSWLWDKERRLDQRKWFRIGHRLAQQV